MQPTRFTRQRAGSRPDPLHVADIPGATSGHPGGLRPRKQPLDPLAPAYQWLPIKEEPAPAPKFVRDTLDVSDIVGNKVGREAIRGGQQCLVGCGQQGAGKTRHATQHFQQQARQARPLLIWLVREE